MQNFTNFRIESIQNPLEVHDPGQERIELENMKVLQEQLEHCENYDQELCCIII